MHQYKFRFFPQTLSSLSVGGNFAHRGPTFAVDLQSIEFGLVAQTHLAGSLPPGVSHFEYSAPPDPDFLAANS